MFERWLEHLDDVQQKVKEDEHAQAIQQLSDELEKARSFFHLAKWYI
jgi:hypothetical protein